MLEGESPNRRTATVWTFIITDGIFFVNRYFCFYTPFLSKTRRLPNQETAVRVFYHSDLTRPPTMSFRANEKAPLALPLGELARRSRD